METKKRHRRIYTKEFKKDAISLITEQGYSAVEAAKSLGINENLLYKWCRDLASDNVLLLSERDELKRLRRENKRLRMEAEILKKASAYFAKAMK